MLLPVDIDMWVAVLWASLLLPLIGLLIRARRLWERAQQEIPPFHWRALIPLLAVAALLPAGYFIYSYPSFRAISHSDLYFVYVSQLFDGFTPPENAVSPGSAALHYWLFHAAVATLVKLTTLDVYSTANLVNFLFIGSSLYWLAQTVVELKLAKSRTFFLFLAIMFLLCALNLSAILSALSAATSGPDLPFHRSYMLLEGADRRLHSTVYKLFNASGMTPGFAAFAAALYCSIRILRRNPQLSELILVSASIVVSLAVMPIIVPFFAVILASLASTALIYCRTDAGGAQRLYANARAVITDVGPSRLGAWLALSLALALPLLNYVIGISNSVEGEVTLFQQVQMNLRTTLAAHSILLPFVLIHLLYAWKRRRRECVFLAMTVLLGLVPALGIDMPDSNQYKFHYLLAVVSALSTLTVLRRLWRSQTGRLRFFALVLGGALITLALLNCAYTQLALATRVVRTYGTARFVGVYAEVQNSDYGRRLSALYWIRDNTAHDAVVLLPLAYSRYASLISGRLTYVRVAHVLHRLDEYTQDARLHSLNVFFDPATSVEAYRQLIDSLSSELSGRPIYAVVYDADVSPEVMARRGAALVFKDTVDAAKVYLLNLRHDE